MKVSDAFYRVCRALDGGQPIYFGGNEAVYERPCFLSGDMDRALAEIWPFTGLDARVLPVAQLWLTQERTRIPPEGDTPSDAEIFHRCAVSWREQIEGW